MLHLKDNIFERCVIYLLKGNTLIVSNENEYCYRRKGQIVAETDTYVIEAMEHGIFKKFAAYVNGKSNGFRWLWYCALDNADLLYRDLSNDGQEALCVDMVFTSAMKPKKSGKRAPHYERELTQEEFNALSLSEQATYTD